MDRASATYGLYGCEDDPPSFDADAACGRLAAALTFRTVSAASDAREFELLHRHIRVSFPLLMARASFETFGQSVLVTLSGTDETLSPIILIAHQDVVPADEAAWMHPPFAGYQDDEYVWGRGALDIKGMLFAELEAAELLLAAGSAPTRTIIFAFGDDEEARSAGAVRLASVLAERGVRDAFLLDEGTTSHADGSVLGAPGTQVQGLCLSQKGFLTVRLTAQGGGGHSSNPFGTTSLEKIAHAICAIRAAMPAPRFTRLLSRALHELGVEQDAALLERLASSRESFPYVADTMAVTQVDGSSPSANVMPYDATATINFRLLPDQSIEELFALVRHACGDAVEAEIVHATRAAREDAPSGAVYDALKDSFERFYPGVSFVPLFMCGGCDAIRYEAVTAQSVRILPYLVPPCDEARIHGVDERISKRAYAQSIRLLAYFLNTTCF